MHLSSLVSLSLCLPPCLSLQSDVTCRCSPTPVLMKTLSDNPLISNFDFQAALSANSSFWRFNLTTERDALPAQFKQRANAIVRTPHNVLPSQRGRILPSHPIADEIAAQMHAFNEAKRLQNNLTTTATNAAAAPAVTASAAAAQATQPTAFIEADAALNSVLLEMDASVEIDELDDEVRRTWPQREARSVDDIVNELHAIIAEERLSAAM